MTGKRHVINAKKIGLDEDKIGEIFAKRGQKKDLSYLDENIFDPYYPSKGIIQKFSEIAEETGQPNPFAQAEPILEKMYEAFSEKNINDPTFGFKLEDFLPPAAPQAQAPLPEQPMPNRS